MPRPPITIIPAAVEGFLRTDIVEKAVGWVKDVKRVKGKELAAYTAGVEQGVGATFARLEQLGYIVRP